MTPPDPAELDSFQYPFDCSGDKTLYLANLCEKRGLEKRGKTEDKPILFLAFGALLVLFLVQIGE